MGSPFPLPLPPFPSFALTPTLRAKAYYFYSPQSSTAIKSKMAATTQRFAHPNYACTAGYV